MTLRFPSMFVPILVLLALNSVPSEAQSADPSALTARIDEHLNARWTSKSIQPGVRIGDEVFLRRVYLDLVGRIPTVPEVRGFLSDTSPDKRSRLVDQLLGSASHAQHWGLHWRREWMPQVDSLLPTVAVDIDRWLERQLLNDVPYDQIVRRLLRASPEQVAGNQTEAPNTFLAAGEFRAENLAANTTRAFLGINLDCAQCHDHPFARWSREQFWETAAFFARPSRTNKLLEVAIPNTNRTVRPRLLIDPQPTWPTQLADDTGRTILAEWVTSKDNPYLARNAVNRVWANLLGTGLVEPLDDLSGENPPSHPELLDELARGFTEGGFDLKHLIAAIVLSEAYQRTSISSVRGLTGEQLYDSLRVAAGFPVNRDETDPTNANRDRDRFADRFRVERPGAAQRSILQALALMNGKVIAELTDVSETPTLRAIAGSPFLGTKAKLRTLYLATLAREPSEEELAPLTRYVENGGAEHDPKQALADVFWALLNSSEFNTNH